MKILLADDELGVLTSLKNLLVGKGYDIDTAMSGFDVVTLHNKNKYDVIIIDVDFKDGQNGIKTSSHIRKEDKKVKIIVITAYEYTQLTRQAVLKIGGNFLIKPVKEQQLLQLIEG